MSFTHRFKLASEVVHTPTRRVAQTTSPMIEQVLFVSNIESCCDSIELVIALRAHQSSPVSEGAASTRAAASFSTAASALRLFSDLGSQNVIALRSSSSDV